MARTVTVAAFLAVVAFAFVDRRRESAPLQQVQQRDVSSASSTPANPVAAKAPVVSTDFPLEDWLDPLESLAKELKELSRSLNRIANAAEDVETGLREHGFLQSEGAELRASKDR